MSIRCSGFASRSFIIGSRLWPPAMIRASEPSRSSDAIAPSTLVARSYSNGAGVCNGAPFRSSGSDSRGSRLRGAPMSSRCSYCSGASVPITGERRQLLRARVPHVRVQLARREAAALDVAQHGPPGLAAAIGASRPSRASVSVPFV